MPKIPNKPPKFGPAGTQPATQATLSTITDTKHTHRKRKPPKIMGKCEASER